MNKTLSISKCRINSHRFDIRQRRTEEPPVAEHFNGAGHTLGDLTVMAIDQLCSHDYCLCKIRESRWIRTLGTSYPLGMNLRVDSLWNLPDDYLRTPWNFSRLTSRLLAIPGSNNYEQDIEYKYNMYYNNNVWSTHPEEDVIEGQNVEEDSALMPIYMYMHEIYCK